MKEDPSESAFRSRLQTTPSCWRPKAVGGERWRPKYRGTDLEPVRVRETTERKPPLTRREEELVVKTRGVFPPGISLPGTWLPGRRRPAWRGRDSDLGFHAEPREPECRCKGRSTSGRNREARVPKRRSGADQPV